MKVYEAVYSDQLLQGVYGISLVEDPAMQDEWIALSEQQQEVQFSAVDDKKKLLLGAVLIPNKKIYRNIDGHEFYMTFSKETIGKLAHDFIKDGFQNSSSAEHDVKLSDVSFVESWQVEDSKVDKSALYGKEYEPGTWVTMAKVSDELYEQATNGTYKGFSIDAMLGLEEIKLNSNINMTKQDFLDAFKAVFADAKVVEEVKETDVVLDEHYDETEEEKVEEEMEEEEISEIDAFKDALTEVMAKFSAEFDGKLDTLKAEFNNQLETKEVEVETKAKEVEELKVELEKQPEVEAIKAKPEAAPREKVQLNKLRTTKSRVFESLSENIWN
jgi:archaellum component FlaC